MIDNWFDWLVVIAGIGVGLLMVWAFATGKVRR